MSVLYSYCVIIYIYTNVLYVYANEEFEHCYLIWFENIANEKISRCLFVIEGYWTKLSQYSIWTFLIMLKKKNIHIYRSMQQFFFDILKTSEFSIYCKHVIWCFTRFIINMSSVVLKGSLWTCYLMFYKVHYKHVIWCFTRFIINMSFDVLQGSI